VTDRFAAMSERLRSVGSHDPAASVSVWLGDLEGRPRWSHRADAPHYAASTMKLPLVIAAQRLAVRGLLDLDAAVPVRNDFASVHDGSPFAMDVDDDQDPETWAALGSTRTAQQLAEHSVTHSGNLATNLLLELVGRAEVAEVLRLAGCSPTTVVGRGIEDAAARAVGITNTVTAADLGVLMAAVARQEPALGGTAVCAPVEAMLGRQQHLDQIPAGLPAGTPTASKSGWVPGVAHDVAVVRPRDREPFVLAVCTTVDLDDEEGAALVAGIAADVWAADAPAEQARQQP
jgi:beta-lactamase class A